MKLILALFIACTVFAFTPSNASAEFRAGAAVVDVTPQQLPVLVNGGMTSRSADKVKSPVTARAIVMDDGARTAGDRHRQQLHDAAAAVGRGETTGGPADEDPRRSHADRGHAFALGALEHGMPGDGRG